VFRLCLHPEIQQKVYEEVKYVFGKKGFVAPATAQENSDFRISYDCLHEMKYLEAFSMEVTQAVWMKLITQVLRLHPSVPREAK
jgi:hypothetical protein